MNEEKDNKNLIITILVLVIVCLLLYLGYDKFIKPQSNNKPENTQLVDDGTNPSKPEDKETTEPEPTPTEPTVKNETVKLGTYEYSGDTGKYHLNLKIIISSDSEMTLSAGNGMVYEEETTGTYKISGNKLVYTRVYAPYSGTMEKCYVYGDKEYSNSKSVQCGNVKRTQEFIIDSTNNTLTLVEENLEDTYLQYNKNVVAKYTSKSTDKPGTYIKTVKKGTYKYNGDTGKYHLNITIKITSDSEMEVSSGNGMMQIEGTAGTYTIKGNVLTYTRKYYYLSSDTGTNKVKCYTMEDKEYNNDNYTDCGMVYRTQEFIIDSDNNTLELVVEDELDDGYRQYKNVVAKLQK